MSGKNFPLIFEKTLDNRVKMWYIIITKGEEIPQN